MENEGSEYVTCPYNASHRILRKRFQVHLGRCRKSFPNANKIHCTFNVTHVFNEQEKEWHMQNCEDRKPFEQYKYLDQSTSKKDTTESDTKLELHPGFSALNDDDDDGEEQVEVPTYNPQAYVQNAPVLRSIQGAPPSEKRQFRKDERERLHAIQEKNKKQKF